MCQTAGATLRIRWILAILVCLASDSHEEKHCGGSLRGEIRVTNPDCQTQEQDESTRRVERGRQRRDKTRARSLRLQVTPHAMSGTRLSPRPGCGQASSLALSPGVDSSDCDIMSCMPRDVWGRPLCPLLALESNHQHARHTQYGSSPRRARATQGTRRANTGEPCRGPVPIKSTSGGNSAGCHGAGVPDTPQTTTAAASGTPRAPHARPCRRADFAMAVCMRFSIR